MSRLSHYQLDLRVPLTHANEDPYKSEVEYTIWVALLHNPTLSSSSISINFCTYFFLLPKWLSRFERIATDDLLARSDHRYCRIGTEQIAARLRNHRNLVSVGDQATLHKKNTLNKNQFVRNSYTL